MWLLLHGNISEVVLLYDTQHPRSSRIHRTFHNPKSHTAPLAMLSVPAWNQRECRQTLPVPGRGGWAYVPVLFGFIVFGAGD